MERTMVTLIQQSRAIELFLHAQNGIHYRLLPYSKNKTGNMHINIILRYFIAIIVAVEKQHLLHILSVCL